MTAKRRKSPRHSLPTSRASVKNSLPALLPSARYFFFGGKGGVGKTTAASATALYLLKHARRNETILLFSTDPAHSLSDSLTKRIGNRLVEISRNRGAKLFAFEMDSKSALDDFRRKHGKVLAEIAERGTLLDKADINELLNLSLPGLDEVMALFELSELDRSAAYSHIVVDTAPSGHTTRLFRLPEVFARMLVALDRMGDKHRYMVAHFARRRLVLDEVDLFLRDLNERIQRVRNLLAQASFALVSIPEAMSVRETERYASALRGEGVHITDVIINRVEEEHKDCNFCRARVAAQRPWLKELERLFEGVRQHRVRLLAIEVCGIDSLELVGRQIWMPTRSKRNSKAKRAVGRSRPTAKMERQSDFTFAKRRIWVFGGKGGVGKTTAAAAYSLALAKRYPRQKVLLFSSDPAHSLSDSFAEPIGALKKRVAGVRNLDAMEIDPGQWFDDLKQRYRLWTDELFASLAAGSRLEIKFDREAMRELVELTPPGIDEIAALGVISDLLDQNRYDSIVLDTAPTGHLIRFLELPQVALHWVRTFIKLLLKYQNVVNASRVGEELVTLSKRIKRVLALLTDSELCEFVGVAIPERMSLQETIDLATSLAQLAVPMQRLLINGVVPDEVAAQCSFCKSRRRSQDSIVKAFRKHFGNALELFIAPQRNQDITGVDSLQSHFDGWQFLAAERGNTRGNLQRTPIAVKNVSKPNQKNERKRTDNVEAK
ncbi:MAG TPA: ArsA family ATPase [Pyrinomonadaceae bacterium]|nr:ArsA family ATPase [Pyrinomonadaceae bacterium]